MDDNIKLIPLRQVCKLVNVKPNTIRGWTKTGKISFVKTPTGQTLYHQEQFHKMFNIFPSVQEKKKIIYCRVSSSKQVKDGDLDRQIEFIKSKYPNHTIISDCASGVNWKRKGLKSILELSMQGNLEELVVAHKDRLSRFGFELIEWIVSSNGGKIIVLDDEKTKSSDQELAEDLLSIIHIYTCKAMGRRRYNSKKTENYEEKNRKESEETQNCNGETLSE